MSLFDVFRRKSKPEPEPERVPSVHVDDMAPWAGGGSRLFNAPYEYSHFDGDKFFGGFGHTQIQLVDYWSLRNRSAQLFNENLYARGIIRRLINNEINTGLCLESTPDEAVLGLPDDALGDWSEDVETRFNLWARSERVCDYMQQDSFSSIQRAARVEALVTGDCLVVLRQTNITRLPSVQLISGNKVQTPLGSGAEKQVTGNRIRYGVETDPAGRHVAYHVIDDRGVTSRIAAYGEQSGRRVAWLVYGTEKRLDDVRGQPLLALVLQSLKEIDRYRDSAQRKAVVNSFLAMFISKTQDKQGTRPITGGAIRRDRITTDPVGNEASQRVREYDIASHIPGLVIEELQVGEEPKAFGSAGTDTDLGTFESIILQGVSWALEIPPEILTLSFNSNYSASQAAINELKLYQNRVRTDFGDHFCQPIYQEWFLSEVLNGTVQAEGFLAAWRDPMQFDAHAAWLVSDWSGAIKLSTDILKQANGYKVLNEMGWITNERASRELTGTKYRKNIKRIKREQELRAELMPTAAPEPVPVSDDADDDDEVVPLRGVSNG